MKRFIIKISAITILCVSIYRYFCTYSNGTKYIFEHFFTTMMQQTLYGCLALFNALILFGIYNSKK